jgi:GNAT superfamily N-acetyltransferase
VRFFAFCIFVAHKHRGKGVGEGLIKYVIGEAKKRNVLCLYVRPVVRNKDAISFFYDCIYLPVPIGVLEK